MLASIRLLHTFVWAVLALCILTLPIAGLKHRYRCALLLVSAVLLECVVLLLNHGKCPLTNVAERYTPDRSANFDIYLPVWLAQHNKDMFGLLFVGGVIAVFLSWVFDR